MAAKSLARCAVAPAGRRRVFWATQIDACGEAVLCEGDPYSATCGRPGLALVDALDTCQVDMLDCHTPGGNCPPVGKTISNANWIEGLALNILMTDARRPDRECGYIAGQRGGHFTDSFRKDGLTAGSRIRYIPPNCSVNNMIALIDAATNDDLQRMVQHGVAISVTAKTTYVGNNQLRTVIDIVGSNGERLRVGVAGQRLKNSWAWGTQKAVNV